MSASGKDSSRRSTSHGSCDIPKRDGQSPSGQEGDKNNLQSCGAACQQREGSAARAPRTGVLMGRGLAEWHLRLSLFLLRTPVPPRRFFPPCLLRLPGELCLCHLSPRPTERRGTPAEGCTWTLTLRLPTWSPGRIPHVSARPHETVPIPNPHAVQTPGTGPAITRTSDRRQDSRVPSPHLRPSALLQGLRELRETLTYAFQCREGRVQGTEEQPGNRGEGWERSVRTFSGCPTLPAPRGYKPPSTGISLEASPRWPDGPLTPLSALPLLQGMGQDRSSSF